jgi:hypothetical protein
MIQLSKPKYSNRSNQTKTVHLNYITISESLKLLRIFLLDTDMENEL